MNSFTKLTFKLVKLPKVPLENTFTPAKAAVMNYVKRKNIDEQLCSEMSTPGKQLIVFGDSGSGKTSSVLNMLKIKKYKFVKTHCESNTTFEQLILNAFDALNTFVVSEKSEKHTIMFKNEFAAEYKQIKSSIASEQLDEKSCKLSRLLPPQLTPQKLAQFMGEGKIVWLIEDFQKVSQEEKRRIADVIKIFVDNANDYSTSKIICIGACESAHELINLNPDLKSRVSEISIPLLNDDEIKKLIVNGFKLLNVSPSDSLIERLVYYSDRLGAYAHQMCMDICKGENISRTNFSTKRLNESSFQYAVDGFINRSSDTFKSIYEAATKDKLGWYILKTFSRNLMNKLSINEIIKIVNKGQCSFDKGQVQEKLNELANPGFEIIYYNSNSEKYALSTPFWHRFLRLQFSIEFLEKTKKKRNKHNQSLSLIANDSKYKLVDESMLRIIKMLTKNQITDF